MPRRIVMPVKSMAFLLGVSFMLSGCSAAGSILGMQLLSAASTGSFVYSQYKLASGATVSYRVDENPPASTALMTIRHSRRVVLFPTGLSDGRRVDVFRQKTDLDVVSSAQTTSWMRQNGFQNTDALPRTERHTIAAWLARSYNADLTVLVEMQGAKTDISAMFGEVETTLPLQVTLIDALTGRALWTERHELVIEGTNEFPPQEELDSAAASGLADRIMELRRGRTRATGTKGDTSTGMLAGVFDCGGFLNFSCDGE